MFCDVFLIRRCWQWTSLIERTFHLDNVAERFTVQWLLVVTVFLLFSKGSCPIFPLPLPFWVPGMDEAKERGPLVGSNVLEGGGVVMYVPRLIFKTCCFAFWEGGHVPAGILLLYLEFQVQYHLHVAVSRPALLVEMLP